MPRGKHYRGTRAAGSALLLTVLLLFPPSTSAQAATEYQVKAAYLYNFAKFVQWPAEAFSAPQTPIRLCVLSDKAFASDLKQIVAGKAINGHPVEAVLLESADTPRGCHVLFISSQNKQVKKVLEHLRPLSILTVGEADGFLQDGGVINFVLHDDRVQFEVSRKAAERAGLNISSRLLAVARLVIQ